MSQSIVRTGIVIITVYMIGFAYIVYNNNLTVVCNKDKTYCSGMFKKSIYNGLSEERGQMYFNAFEPNLSGIYYFLRLMPEDPVYLFRKILQPFLIFWLFVLPAILGRELYNKGLKRYSLK